MVHISFITLEYIWTSWIQTKYKQLKKESNGMKKNKLAIILIDKMISNLLLAMFLVVICVSTSNGESFTQKTGSGVGGVDSVKGIGNTILGNLSKKYKGKKFEIKWAGSMFTLEFEKHLDSNYMNSDTYEIEVCDCLLGNSPYKVSRSGRNVTLSNASAKEQEAFKLVKVRKGRFGDDQYVNSVVLEARGEDDAKIIYNAFVKFFNEADKLSWD
jgi:hypothetical protein